MVINTNLAASAASRHLSESTSSLSASLARLSSGSKITSPEDDAAGLAQSMRMSAQINRNTAVRANISNAISFSQTQDAFLQRVEKAINRLGEISVLAMDITKTDTDRSNYSVEFEQLQAFVSDVGQKQYNGVSLFWTEGESVTIDSDGKKFQMNEIALPSPDAAVGMAGIHNPATVDVDDVINATKGLSRIQTAVQNLAVLRAKVGANIQRLKMTNQQVSILNENLTAARSRIQDVNIADESTRYAKANILTQSGATMLSQANILPQSALRLIQ